MEPYSTLYSNIDPCSTVYINMGTVQLLLHSTSKKLRS